jgi:hypothetical protein
MKQGCQQPDSPVCLTRRDLLLSSLHFVHLDIQDHIHVLADNQPAGFHRTVPFQVVIETVDGGLGLEAGLFASWRGLCAAEGNIPGDGFGHITYGHVANELEFIAAQRFHGRTLEFDGGEFLRVEEIITLQVIVTTTVLGVDRGRINGEADLRIGEISLGMFHRAIEYLETSVYFGDRHVGDGELDIRMCLVHCPLGNLGLGGGESEGKGGQAHETECESLHMLRFELMNKIFNV